MNVSATWVSQSSCHKDCPFQDNGCYAEVGRANLHTQRLNRIADESGLSSGDLKVELARQEATLIAGLTGRRKLRAHVVGDCSTRESAGIVGRAMVKHEAKHGQPAWTYTHSWRSVPYSSWKGARVMASVESTEQVKQAWGQGYQGVALVVPPHDTHKTYGLGGITVIPCPAQFRQPNGQLRTTCEDCRICQDVHRLGPNNRVVGFQPDMGTAPKVLQILRKAA